MSHDAHLPSALPEKIPFYLACKVLGLALLLIGVGAFVGALKTGHPEAAWGGYLIGLFFTLGLAVFGVLWIAIQYLTKAAWGVTMRRIPEAMSSWLLPSVVLTPMTALGAGVLYHWSHPEAVAADELLSHKAAFLNLPAFVGTLTVVVAIWALFGWRMVASSRKQDQSGSAAHTFSNVSLSAVFALVFAPSFSVLSFYLLMSLEPHWFSTMYAVLCFTDIMQTGFALIALIVAVLVARGMMKGFLDQNHLHDITKMAYAFTGFWAYIYFCQFMLIWYANISEETVYFMNRASNGWLWWMVALPLVKFLVPFLVLTPRENKRRPMVVIPMMLWLLAAQFVELYLLVGPALGHGEEKAHGHAPMWELGVFLGFVGAFWLVFRWVLSRHGAVPGKDPYLGAALRHQV